MRIELSRTAHGSKGFQRPFVRRLVMSENIGVAVIGLDAEVEGIGAVPLVIDRFDEMRHFAKPELYRPLVRFMTRIGFNTKFHTVILTLVAIGRELSAVIDRRYICHPAFSRCPPN